MFPVATKELAIIQAMDWCLTDEIEYKGPEPQEQATKDAIAKMKAAYADMDEGKSFVAHFGLEELFNLTN